MASKAEREACDAFMKAQQPRLDAEERAVYVGTIPAGARIRAHPSGDGCLVVHPDRPLVWIHPDGTTEEVRPPSDGEL